MAAADVLISTNHPHEHEPVDNTFSLDELLRRKRDVEKNKKRYRLTEADCSLMLTNANEFTFQAGQIILAQGQEISSMYRIKSGSVILKNATCECEVGQGWFFGESLLLNNHAATPMPMSLIAKGPVSMLEINVPFVRKLFAADGVLALKFYRSVASKLATIFYALHGNCIESTRATEDSASSSSGSMSSSTGLTDSSGISPRLSLSRSVSMSSNSSSSSSSSTSSSDSQEPSTPTLTRVGAAAFEFMRKRKNKPSVSSAYKEYPLGGNGNVHRRVIIKTRKIKVISEYFGFRKKRSMEYARVVNISRPTDVAVTILYDESKATTLFFRSNMVANEFSGLVQSIIDQVRIKARRLSPNTPLSQPTSPEVVVNRLDRTTSVSERLTVFLDSENSEDSGSKSDDAEDDDFFEDDNDLIKSIADKKVLRKGEVLFEEGDLFQRLYTVTQGNFDVVKEGKVVCHIGEGRVFGEASLLHMRPSPFTLVVASDEAVVRVIPAHKLFKLTDANPLLAARLHRKAAQLLEEKICQCKLEMLRRTINIASSSDSISSN